MADNQAVDPTQDNLKPEAEGQEGSILTSKNSTTEAQPEAKAEGEAVKPQDGAKPERPAWMAQLPKELQAHETLTKFKAIGDVGKSYIELEGKLGKAIVPPEEGATDEEWRAYYKKLGAPEKPENYTLDASVVPKELYSKEMEQSFRQWAFDEGLSQKQAASLFGKYNEFTMAAVKGKDTAERLQKETVLNSLKEEWGPSYKENLSYMERAFSTFGNPKIAKAVDRIGNDPDVIKMFVNIGKQLREGPILSSNSSGQGRKSPEEVLYGSK